MSSPAPLVTTAWWRVLAERLARQAAETAVPVLSAVVAAGAVLDLKTVLVGLAGVETVTLGKAFVQYLLGVHVDPAAPFLVQALDRAVPAAAGVVAAVPIVSWADALTTDWASVGQKAVIAAVLAQLAVYVTPPAFAHRAPGAGAGPVAAPPLPAAGMSVADRLDGGWSRVSVAIILATAAVLAAAIPASAHYWHAPQQRPVAAAGQVVAPRVARTGVCDGVLVVHWDATVLGQDRVWGPLRDDGRAQLEVHETATGRWIGAVTRSGGDHVLRWDGYRTAGPDVDLARVVASGYRSVGYPTAEPCA